MNRRNRKCPLDLVQDGVCGCRAFWERKTPASLSRPNRPNTSLKPHVDTLRSPSPSRTPPGPPRETCFFWYHGTCHRGAQCKFAHESHMTWPMAPPPGFIHYEKCILPLCPLRQDLVGVKTAQDTKNITKTAHIGGQMDGAALSFLRRPTITETAESDADDECEDDDHDSGKSDEKSDNDSYVSRDYGDHSDKDDDEDSSLASFNEIGRAASSDDDECDETDQEAIYIEEAEESFLSSNNGTPLQKVTIEISSDEESQNSDQNLDASENEEAQESLVPLSGLQYAHPVIEISSSEDDSDAPNFDTGDNAVDRQSSMSIIDPSSRAMNGSYSSSEDDSVWRSAVELPSEEGDSFATAHNPSDTAAKLLTTSDLGYVDLTCYTPPPPMSSSALNSPLLSLSHAGTLKRKRTTSPNDPGDDSCKRKKREATPYLDSFTSIINRQRKVSNWDVKPTIISSLHSTSTPASPTHDLPSKHDNTPSQADQPVHHHPADYNPRSYAPNGPRALGGDNKPICFYWYHKGNCQPRRGKNGRPVRCAYAHTLDGPCTAVSLPPRIDRHDPNCALPLCPVRLYRGNLDIKANGATIHRKTSANHEPVISPRYHTTPISADLSSPSYDRAFIRQSSRVVNPNIQHLRPGTSAVRQRSKIRSTSINYRENKITTLSPDRGRRRTSNPTQRQRRQRKLQKRQLNTLDYGSEIEESGLKHHSSEFDEGEIPQGRWAQILDSDSEIEGPNGPAEPISGLVDNVDQVADYTEQDRNTQERGDMALDMKEGRKYDNKVSSRRAAIIQKKRGLEPDTKMSKERVYKVLVDYELPMGEERLPWDTNYVRRIFGEIE